jgi:glycosyltransferase involved in cell wall biosynthesis
VEAARHGVPVIASDIAVFREVAGDGAEYFPLGEKRALMALVERFAGYDSARRTALAARVSLLSWRDSARQLATRLAACFDAPPQANWPNEQVEDVTFAQK